MALYQPPVHSPLTLGNLAAGLRADPGTATSALKETVGSLFGPGEVTLVGSGTQALDLALRIARQALGDPSASAALPAYSCFDVATAAVGAQVPVRFYDLDPLTLAPDQGSFARALELGARIAVVAPLYGYPVAWDWIEDRAAKSGAIVIEDAAQAASGRWDGRPIGSFGHLTVLSFGRGKGWTGGGGGALIRRDVRVRSLPEAGRSPLRGPAQSGGAALRSMVQWALGRPGLYGLPANAPGLGLGETRYRDPTPAAAISTFSAGLAVATAEGSQREAAVRRGVADRFKQGMERSPHLSGMAAVRAVPGAEPGFLRLAVLLGSGRRVARSVRALGVAGGYPSILADLPEVAPIRVDPGAEYPGARRLVKELVTLPTHRFVSPSLQAKILLALDSSTGA